MSVLPTLRVVSPESPDGYMVINEGDFVEGEHERWEEPKAKAELAAGGVVGGEVEPYLVGSGIPPKPKDKPTLGSKRK